ncbi:hypothetical protein ELI30_08730 [Rhizobium leguminosarum]|uniref:hypothetical protein n=1 Tax=Rhizobium leguminosarum TaxID=384 RepID=UPI00102F68F8|nr:hypothetical protein [Rhizobium leguminosarum]TAV48380.1 hypothetical protein ELI32_09185 [Rhizobium leguminosarum]TAV57880.1 hypothetical protein ELI31_08715 [Rhizobium leguminosarum]TAV68820.1 hypothetical protein ELI30_08730 [Rhizobium leguminosarum]
MVVRSKAVDDLLSGKMPAADKLEPQALDRGPMGFDDGLRASELLLQNGLNPPGERAVHSADAVDQALVDASRPRIEDAVHAEMAVQDDRQAGRPVEIGGDPVSMFAKEDLLGGPEA